MSCNCSMIKTSTILRSPQKGVSGFHGVTPATEILLIHLVPMGIPLGHISKAKPKDVVCSRQRALSFLQPHQEIIKKIILAFGPYNRLMRPREASRGLTWFEHARFEDVSQNML
jgi:hypothetical protein